MAKAFGAYVHLKVAETQAELQRMINTSFANTKLNISTIEFAPQAITHLQSELQTMLTQIGQNLHIDLAAITGSGSSAAAEQTASAEERAANAAERRAAASSSEAQSAASNATAEQQAAAASEQRLRYNEQNNSVYVETADLNQAETSRLSEQLRLLSQVVQMRTQLVSMMSSGVVSSDSADAQTLLNTLNTLQSSITSNLAPTRAELTDITAQVSAAQVAMRSFNEELVQAGNIGSINVQTDRFNTLEKKLLTLRLQIQKTLISNSNVKGTGTETALNSLVGQIDQCLIKLRSMGVISENTYREMNSQIGTMGVNFQSLKGNMVEFGETGNGVITRLISGFQKFGGWMVVTRTLTAVIRLFKQMISYVKEIDSAMTQLKIVTKATSEEMSRFSDSIADTAVKIGASITDLTELATTYSRLGYSLGESETLAKYTSMLTKVGNIDTSDAQDAVTAITKAFDIDASQIEMVMDKLVAVGNNFPISTSEIAEGMNNASSALAAAGNTFEQSIALLTAANTTVNLCRAA